MSESPNHSKHLRFLKFSGDGEVTSVSTNKEGSKGGDGAVGLTIRIKSTVSSAQAALLMRSDFKAGELDNTFWREGALRVYGIDAIPLSSEFEFCYLTAFEGGETECKVNKVVLRPISRKGTWEVAFNAYVRDPALNFVDKALHGQKMQTPFQLEQKSLNITDQTVDGEE